VAGDDAHASAREREPLGEQVDDRVVRTPVLRRGGDADLPALAVAPGDLGS
jgi:hypothetical protein